MPSIANFCPVLDTDCTLLCNRNIHQLRTRDRTIGIKCVQRTFGSGLYLYHLRFRKHNVLPGVPVFERRSVRTFWTKRNAALSMWHMCGEVDCWKHNQTHIRTLCTFAPNLLNLRAMARSWLQELHCSSQWMLVYLVILPVRDTALLECRKIGICWLSSAACPSVMASAFVIHVCIVAYNEFG